MSKKILGLDTRKLSSPILTKANHPCMNYDTLRLIELYVMFKNSQLINLMFCRNRKKFRSLKKPRRVMLMVQAGAAVQSMIDQLIPLLENGDIIIDGGNSEYHDSNV